MKKLEIIIKPEKLESLKTILEGCKVNGLISATSWDMVIRKATRRCTGVPSIM